jgi:group I intron endonuclease
VLDNSGIYAIVNRTTGDYYIGSALVLRKRRNSHFHALRQGKHDSVYLQRAWEKYGSGAFYFHPFIVCRREDLIFFEQRAIDALKPRYNMRALAGSNLGAKFSDEAKAKMRAAKLGKKQNPVHVEARAALLRGVKRGPITETHRENLRRAHLGISPANKGKRGPSPPNKGTGLSYAGRNVTEWAAFLKVHPNTIYARIHKMGMSLEEAVRYG